jgi:hypothetical protein
MGAAHPAAVRLNFEGVTTIMKIKSAESCDYDIVSLGEIMLRLDPGHGVARGMRKCFGLRGAVVTAFVDNEVGHLLEDFVMQGGVDTNHIKWYPHDGLGRTIRNGLNFTERGFGVRGAVGCVDRGNTAASKLEAGDIDWEHIFGEHGARWFHTGGIFAALSATAPDVIIEALKHAGSTRGAFLRLSRRRHPTSSSRRSRAWHANVVRPQLPGIAVARVWRPGALSRGQS